MPSTTFLRASLKLWEARARARKALHTRAQRDLERARDNDVHPRQQFIDRRDLRSRQLKEARENVALRQRQLAGKRKAKRPAASRQGKAIAWAADQVGTRERPPNSNRGVRIDSWQREIASGAGWLLGAPYCGIGVGVALRRAGVNGVTSRVAAVAYIEDDARAGRNGFSKLVGISSAQPGDLVCLFGRGVHVEIITGVDRSRRVLRTIGFNTSPGVSGSQANGGGVYRRARPFSAAYAIARPRY